MAGGDGSLATVAAVAAAHGLPFVCIPVGTRNHFALDLGVDRQDVPGALDAFTEGVERLVDVGDVNGRTFLNNVSLGIYGEAVQRAGYRDTKVRTLAEAARQVLGPERTHASASPGGRHRASSHTSRCPPRLQQPVRADRTGSRYSTHARRRPAGILVLDGPDETPHPAGRAWSALQVHVGAPTTVLAGIDGEAVEIAAPLEFAVRPTALRVRICERHPGASPAARIPPHRSARDGASYARD